MPLLWLSLAFLFGVVLADALALHIWAWLGLLVCFALLAFFDRQLRSRFGVLSNWRRHCPLSPGVVLAVVALGALRYQTNQTLNTPTDLAWYNGRGFARVVGVVEVADLRETAALLQVRAQALELLDEASDRQPKKVEGLLQVMLPPGGEWRYGDMLELVGKVETPPQNEDFSYRDILARRGIYSYMAFPRVRLLAHDRGNPLLAGIDAFRRAAYEVIGKLFPQPEAGLLSGILLGIENDIPEALQDAFRDTGTSHIIAISGFNISILAGLFALFAARLFPNRWVALGVVVIGIAFYTVLVGAQASVVRAAVMGGMSLLGRYIGRRQTGANSLAFTAALMTLFNPQLPWDVSFQLSFMATLGLVLYADPLQQSVHRLLAGRMAAGMARRVSALVSEYVLFTIAAQVTTLPVILYHFHRLSLTALLANPLILPPQPLVMVLGGVTVLAGMVFLPLGKALGVIAWVPAAYTIRVVEWLARIPQGARTLGEFGLGWVALFYIILLGATFWRKPLWAARRRFTPWALMGSAGLIAAGVWSLALSAPDGKLHMTVLNFANIPAVLVETPTGGSALIGGSSNAGMLSSVLALRLPLASQKLDVVVVPTSKAAPMKALPEVIERFTPQMVLWNEEKAGSAAARNLVRALEKQSRSPQLLQAGQVLQFDGGVSLRVLSVSPESTALLLEYGGFTALFAGGGWEENLPEEVSVLVLAQQDGAMEVQNLPRSQVVVDCARTAGTGKPGSLTCVADGWIEIVTDGHRMWVNQGK